MTHTKEDTYWVRDEEIDINDRQYNKDILKRKSEWQQIPSVHVRYWMLNVLSVLQTTQSVILISLNTKTDKRCEATFSVYSNL